MRAFFPYIMALFFNFQKRAGETSPPSPPSSYTPGLQVNRFAVYSLAWDTFQDLDTFKEHNTEENKKYNIISQELRNKQL